MKSLQSFCYVKIHSLRQKKTIDIQETTASVFAHARVYIVCGAPLKYADVNECSRKRKTQKKKRKLAFDIFQRGSSQGLGGSIAHKPTFLLSVYAFLCILQTIPRSFRRMRDTRIPTN